MEKAILIIFLILLFLIFVYSLSELHLLINFLKGKKTQDTPEKYDLSSPAEVPFVTIQLPIYNEKNVVRRLLKNIAQVEYPREKLEIQVLDDSTDESVLLTSTQVSELQSTGLDIQHIRRDNRKGFKAGALKEGLESAKGEFIAVFDSDFLPKRDWLLQTVPYFKNKETGVVQTRWGHLNRDYSLLTRVQAFALDFHFVLEQNGRNQGQHFINFNGTAGIWRRECILEAGNWQGDTLTEDLDLSYRAQLKKWKFRYLGEVETPAELPITLPAARSQQFRWNKGAAENFRKNYFGLLKDQSISPGTKFHAFFHLLNSSMFLTILMLATLSIPVLYILDSGNYKAYIQPMVFFGISTLIFFICYWVPYSATAKGGGNLLSYIFMFFTFFSVAMGFSVHNSVAVLEGHLGKKSDFIRTPKFNISDKRRRESQLQNAPVKLSLQLLFEIFLLFYFIFGIFSAFLLHNFGMFLFHLMLTFGFGYVVFHSLNFSRFFDSGKELADLPKP